MFIIELPKTINIPDDGIACITEIVLLVGLRLMKEILNYIMHYYITNTKWSTRYIIVDFANILQHLQWLYFIREDDG